MHIYAYELNISHQIGCNRQTQLTVDGFVVAVVDVRSIRAQVPVGLIRYRCTTTMQTSSHLHTYLQVVVAGRPHLGTYKHFVFI